eukprot:14961902-Ditylum_brightwellii.AAC.1
MDLGEKDIAPGSSSSGWPLLIILRSSVPGKVTAAVFSATPQEVVNKVVSIMSKDLGSHKPVQNEKSELSTAVKSNDTNVDVSLCNALTLES